MITNYLIKKLNCTNYAIVIFTLIIGIVFGIVFSLLIPQELHWLGIILSILVGILSGFTISMENDKDGIFIGITLSLFVSAVYEISIGIQYPLWLFGLIVLVLTEVLFLLDKTTPDAIDNNHIMWFTTGRKIEALVESIVIFMVVKGVGKEVVNINYSKTFPIIFETLKSAGLIVGVIALLYAFIWINSWRYRKK